jgi:hypothetical protein
MTTVEEKIIIIDAKIDTLINLMENVVELLKRVTYELEHWVQ